MLEFIFKQPSGPKIHVSNSWNFQIIETQITKWYNGKIWNTVMIIVINSFSLDLFYGLVGFLH